MAKQVKISDFVTIHPTGDGEIKVSWQFTVFSKHETDGKVSCYIPSFDIYFTSSNQDEDFIGKKGEIITHMFIDHFFKHTRSIKNFALEMHKRGFRAANDAFTVKEYIKNNISKAKFKFGEGNVADGYVAGAIKQSEMQVAAA